MLALTQELRGMVEHARKDGRPSNKAVNRAGEILRHFTGPKEDVDRAIEVVDYWRNAHFPPLYQLIMRVREIAQAVDPGNVIANRTKRLPSIISKLQRRSDSHMKLSTMNDVGAGRVVVSTVDAVRDVTRQLEMRPPDDLVLIKRKDYIANPPESGYRSVHLIYQCPEGVRGDPLFRGLTIELQIRSRLQHAWATAVETTGTFRREPLKSGLGDPNWLRFFALAGSVIAGREGTPAVPATPNDPSELVSEIHGLGARLRVFDKLSAYSLAPKFLTDPDVRKANYFLMELDLSRLQIGVRIFSDFSQAVTTYAAAEKQTIGNPDLDTVLVSVESIGMLEIAYPNYFADTGAFLDAIYSKGIPSDASSPASWLSPLLAPE